MAKIDINAPIIPFEGLGGIKLYSTIEDLQDILKLNHVSSEVVHNQWIKYNIQDCIELLFHIKNRKLFLMRTLDRYQGLLFGKIAVGTTEEEMVKAEPTFIYDDFEEVWETEKGVFIETDGKTNKVRWISVFIKELNDEDFNEANW